MNESFNATHESADQQRQIDRLVDGELSTEARRALLKSLDATPGAWRRCALAFVESQSLGQELSAIAAESVPAMANLDSSRPTVRSKAASDAAGWFAMAAAVLVAFGMGTFGARWLENRGAAVAPDSIVNAGPHGAAPQDLTPPNTAPESVIEEPQMATAPLVADALDGESLTLWVKDRQGGRRSLTAPLVDAATLDREHGLTFPSAVTPQIRQDWEGRGYQLSSRRRYAPLYLDNGQPLVVPVEDVQIVPVSGTAL